MAQDSSPKKASARKAAAKRTSANQSTSKKAQTHKSNAQKSVPDGRRKGRSAPPKPADVRKSKLAAARKLSPSAPMSKYFKRARDRATTILHNPDELKRIAEEANRTGASRSGHFAAVIDDFRTLIRLVVAYARGNYREIPPDSLALVVGGLIYVVSPLDVIPDILPAGYLDDAAVVVWVVKIVRDELDAFRAWELGEDSNA